MNPEQRFMIDKMSTMIARESSDPDESSDDADLDLEQENITDVQRYARKILQSSNPVDQKLMSVYNLRKKAIEKRRDRARKA